MVATLICSLCQRFSLPGLMSTEPSHCYGRTEHVVPGVLGGYRCECECRTWGEDDQ
jgi:hypothetical protein